VNFEGTDSLLEYCRSLRLLEDLLRNMVFGRYSKVAGDLRRLIVVGFDSEGREMAHLHDCSHALAKFRSRERLLSIEYTRSGKIYQVFSYRGALRNRLPRSG
jgi:hypothetical protein